MPRRKGSKKKINIKRNMKKNLKKTQKRKKGGGNNVNTIPEWLQIINNLVNSKNGEPTLNDSYKKAYELSNSLVNYEKTCDSNNNQKTEECRTISNISNSCNGNINCEKLVVLLRNPIIKIFIQKAMNNYNFEQFIEETKQKNLTVKNNTPILLKQTLTHLGYDVEKINESLDGNLKIKDGGYTIEELKELFNTLINNNHNILENETKIKDHLNKYFEYYFNNNNNNKNTGPPSGGALFIGIGIAALIIIIGMIFMQWD